MKCNNYFIILFYPPISVHFSLVRGFRGFLDLTMYRNWKLNVFFFKSLAFHPFCLLLDDYLESFCLTLIIKKLRKCHKLVEVKSPTISTVATSTAFGLWQSYHILFYIKLWVSLSNGELKCTHIQFNIQCDATLCQGLVGIVVMNLKAISFSSLICKKNILSIHQFTMGR